MMINNITKYNTTLLLMHFDKEIKNERKARFVFRFSFTSNYHLIIHEQLWQAFMGSARS